MQEKIQGSMESKVGNTVLQSISNHSMGIQKTGERDVIPAQSPPLDGFFSSHLNGQQSTQPTNWDHEANDKHVNQGGVPDHLSNRQADGPLAKHDVTWQGTPFMLSTPTNTDNVANATLTSSETATVPTSAASSLTVLRSQGNTFFLENYESKTDAKRPKKRHESPLNRDPRVKVLPIVGCCSDCRRRRVNCQPAHLKITLDDNWWSLRSCIRSSAEKDVAPAAAGHLDQQSHATFQEGTVADSGYVSACASRPHHESKPYVDLADHGARAQPEEYDRPAGDQQTVYTSLALPHGSDYITDLCNDIHLRLKHELQEHTRDQAQTELPKCLPDLIKALAIRIGLDRSNPASPYVMHFLHTHCR